MTEKQKDTVVAALTGTSGVYDAAVCLEYNITQDELDAVMEARDCFRCETCGWWCEIEEEVENTGGDRQCQECHDSQ